MLGKLLRFDFRSMWKQFSLIWPAILVLALINRFTLGLKDNNGIIVSPESSGVISVIAITVFAFLIIAMFIISFIFILQRFNKGILGDEGYLMHTLPVRTWQLVLSKLICAIFITVMNTIVVIAAVFILVPLNWSEFFRMLNWDDVVAFFTQQDGFWLYVLEVIMLIISSLSYAYTMVYLAMAIGHMFNRSRVLLSILAFGVIEITTNIIISGLSSWTWLSNVLRGDHAGTWFVIVGLFVGAAVFFTGTSVSLKKRLNLE